MKRALRVVTVVGATAALSLFMSTALGGPPSTVVRTIQKDASGLLSYGPGEPHQRPSGFTGKLTPVLGFVQMTDIHLTDEESPGRLEFLDQVAPFGGAYRPNEALSTQTLEAMVRQVRNAVSPLTQAKPQFAVVTGDLADSQQYNEARWLIDILDGGKTVNPDSGVYTGTPAHLYDGVQGGQYYDPDGAGDATSPYAGLRNFPGLLEKAQQPFTAAGLHMPWYAALGNHDGLILGNGWMAYWGPGGMAPTGSGGSMATFPSGVETANALIRPIPVGSDKLLDFPNGHANLATVVPQLQALMTYGVVTLQQWKAANPSLFTTVPADPRRCYLAKDNPMGTPFPTLPGVPSFTVPCDGTSWSNELLNHTTGSPLGHGFAPAASATGYGRPASAIANRDGYYSFSPKPGFRFVVLDTVTDFCPSGTCDFGSLDAPQLGWLQEQLGAAKTAGERVIVISHHPLTSLAQSTTDPATDPSFDPTEYPRPTNAQVKAALCSNDNVLATVYGHTHDNLVSTIDCGAGKPAITNVNTTSEMDYPAQARLIEVVANASGQLALALTMIDNQAPPRVGTDLTGAGVLQLASISREIGAASGSGAGGVADRNVVIPLGTSLP